MLFVCLFMCLYMLLILQNALNKLDHNREVFCYTALHLEVMYEFTTVNGVVRGKDTIKWPETPLAIKNMHMASCTSLFFI